VVPTGSKSSARLHMPDARESGDLTGASLPMEGGRQSREGDEPQAVMQASEESRAAVVPEKQANSEVTPEESVEGRAAANGKLDERNALRTQDRDSALTYLSRVGERKNRSAVDRRWEPDAGNPHVRICGGSGLPANGKPD
jgi:hypothetical protein